MEKLLHLRSVARLLLIGACIFASSPLQAQDRPPTSGEIDFEDTKHQGLPAYEVHQNAAIEYFKQLDSRLEGGAVGAFEPPSEPVINHLTGAYLYCSVNNGTCPFLLDAVLEVDLMNAAASRTPSCPAMTGFWKQWVRNDFEERHKYLVKTGFLQQTSNFKQNVRPKYLKCKETVAQLLDSNAVNAKRYAQGSAARDSIAQTVAFLDGLKSSVPNVFIAMGARKAAEAKDEAAQDNPRGRPGRRSAPPSPFEAKR